MKHFALMALLLWQSGARDSQVAQPVPQYFAYQRAVVPASPGTNCAVLDASTFAHASSSLNDLRLYPQARDAHEIPYAITLSEPEQPDTDPASVLNLGWNAGGTNAARLDCRVNRRAWLICPAATSS